MTDLQERIARHVYRAMRRSHVIAGGLYVDWMGGDDKESMQTARAVAQDILNDIKAEEKTDDAS